MPFTIEVVEIPRDADVSFEELQLFHADCLGGRLLVKEDGEGGAPDYRLTCRRCGGYYGIDSGEDGAANVVLTAIDGQEREFDSHSGEALVRRRANHATTA